MMVNYNLKKTSYQNICKTLFNYDFYATQNQLKTQVSRLV